MSVAGVDVEKCPNQLMSLDLQSNLLSSWAEVITQLHTLTLTLTQ